MSKQTSSDQNKQGPFSNPTVVAAVITGIVTLVGALIAVSPQLIPLLSGPTETPIPTLTATEAPTNRPTATEDRVTATATQILQTPTATLSPTPTETATITPVTPPLGCLDRWEVISSAPGTVFSSGNCEKYSYPDLGIEPIQDTVLSFAQPSILINETTGIITRFSNDVTEISFDVMLDDISDGEFWIALSDGDNPDNNAVSIRIQSNGLVRMYDVNGNFYTDQTWNELREGTLYGANKPFYYNFVIRISGSNLSIGINSIRLTLTGRPDHFFLGYKNKSAVKEVTVFVEVSNLEMK